MKTRMIIWLGFLLTLQLIVACSGVYIPALEPAVEVEPATVQSESLTESPNEEPDVDDEQIQSLASDFTLLDGDGYMVNIGAISWRDPGNDSNMVNLGALIWRNVDKQKNQHRDIGTTTID